MQNHQNKTDLRLLTPSANHPSGQTEYSNALWRRRRSVSITRPRWQAGCSHEGGREGGREGGTAREQTINLGLRRSEAPFLHEVYPRRSMADNHDIGLGGAGVVHIL